MNDGAYDANKFSGGYFKGILKSVAIAFIVTFIILITAALLLCFTDFPERYTLPSAIAATVLGVFSGSYNAARKNESNSMVSALLTALLYAILAFIIGCVVQGKVMVSSNTALFAAIALVTGGIASILAGKAGKSKGKYKGGSNYITDKFRKDKVKSYKLGKGGN